eukprot:351801-Chlamydomonas_euryale.AAC.2
MVQPRRNVEKTLGELPSLGILQVYTTVKSTSMVLYPQLSRCGLNGFWQFPWTPLLEDAGLVSSSGTQKIRRGIAKNTATLHSRKIDCQSTWSCPNNELTFQHLPPG